MQKHKNICITKSESTTHKAGGITHTPNLVGLTSTVTKAIATLPAAVRYHSWSYGVYNPMIDLGLDTKLDKVGYPRMYTTDFSNRKQ